MNIYKRHNVKLLFILIVTFVASNLQAQLTLTDLSQLPKLKKSTVYVVFKDTSAAQAKPYMDAIRSVWTFSKLEFLNRDNLPGKINQKNYFLSIETISKTNKSLHYAGAGNTETQYVQTYSIPYLMLWHPSSIKENKQGKEYILEEIARLELYMDYQKINYGNPDYSLDIDNNFMYLNLNPGFVKNYIQTLNSLLVGNKTLAAKTSYSNISKLSQLKTDTLFVPRFVLKGMDAKGKLDQSTNTVNVTFDFFTNKSSDIFEGYEFTYKMISDVKLGNKIIESETPFYYLLFVNEVASRYITVVNSLTGEIVYCQYSKLKPRKSETRSLNNKDILALQKMIKSQKK